MSYMARNLGILPSLVSVKASEIGERAQGFEAFGMSKQLRWNRLHVDGPLHFYWIVTEVAIVEHLYIE